MKAICRQSLFSCWRPLGRISSSSIYRRTLSSFSSELVQEIQVFARKKQSPVGIKALLETGRGEYVKNTFSSAASSSSSLKEKVAIQIASFLHRELPIRFAHRALHLDAIPLLQTSKHVVEISSWYKQSFADIRRIPTPKDACTEEQFFRVIQNIYTRHSNTLLTMAMGAYDIRRQHFSGKSDDFAQFDFIQTELNNFYMSRIDIRTLIGHYLALRQGMNLSNNDPPLGVVGLINEKASPYAIALSAIEDARYMCMRTHGDAPEVELRGRLDLTLPQIPDHIKYILLELLKNSMRATVEFHGVDNPLPNIKVIIADGENNEDVVIKVSDEGGGIARSNMHKIWSYLFTTADSQYLESFLKSPVENNLDSTPADFNTASPLAGLGYGLPISRCYARHFGGDLTLMSMEGYGTDGYVYLSRI